MSSSSDLRDAIAQDDAFSLRLQDYRMSRGEASVAGSSINAKAVMMERSPNPNSAPAAG